jgi:hypothetical protein
VKRHHVDGAVFQQAQIPIPSVLYEWARRNGIDFWYATPSLSQHIGNASVIWENAGLTFGRRAPWFSGSIDEPFALEEDLADFPEQSFECNPTDRDGYQRRVERGRERMKESTVVFCGLCRDVRHFLPRLAARVERLGAMFRDYRVVLYENDSKDRTLEFLSDWRAANPRIEVLGESVGVARYPQIDSAARAEWLARCRNRYRERVAAEYADFDHAIVIDTDLAGGWSYDGVAHTFGEDDWDGVGSYGVVRHPAARPGRPCFRHHDVLAFRPAVGTVARMLVDHDLGSANRDLAFEGRRIVNRETGGRPCLVHCAGNVPVSPWARYILGPPVAWIGPLIDCIRTSPLSEFQDAAQVERLLLHLGLHEPIDDDVPAHLLPFCGKGLAIRRRPKELAAFLAWMATRPPIGSYVEVGSGNGGGFIATVEFLRRFHPLHLAISVGSDAPDVLLDYVSRTGGVHHVLGDRATDGLQSIVASEGHVDLVLIDAQRPDSGSGADWDYARSYSRYVAIHGIAAAGAPVARSLWEEIRASYRVTCEFVDRSLPAEMRFGLGVVDLAFA